jgi:hypothetical protein
MSIYILRYVTKITLVPELLWLSNQPYGYKNGREGNENRHP